MGKKVFSAFIWPLRCTWPNWNEGFWEDFDISSEFFLTKLLKIHEKYQNPRKKTHSNEAMYNKKVN